MDLPIPTFPPLLNGIAVDGSEPFAVARAGAISGSAGAGDVFWSTSPADMKLAVVLEPDVDAGRAMQMLFATMVAIGDALGALAPPELGIYYRWPGGILINGARVGQTRVALPDNADAATTPDWMVVAMDMRIHGDPDDLDPGLDTENTSLYEEGGIEVTRTDLIESFCRHFLVWVNDWQSDGFKAIHELWTGRYVGLDKTVDLEFDGERHAGAFVGLDDLGNLLYRPEGNDVRSLDVLGYAERGAGAL